MWKKVNQAGKVPHLSRWFDYVSELPEVKSTVDELDLSAKRKAIAAADNAETGKKAGGECCTDGIAVGALLMLIMCI